MIFFLGLLSFAMGAVEIFGALVQITASPNYLWGVNKYDQIWKCTRPCSGAWEYVSGALVQVDASDDEVWGVNDDGDVFKRPVDGSGSWVLIASKFLQHVSASGNGYIWGIDKDTKIYKCKKPCSGDFEAVDGSLKQIDGGERYVFGVNSVNQVYYRPVDGSESWSRVGTQLLQYVTASSPVNVYGVDTANYVYSCEQPCSSGNFQLISGISLNQVDGTFDAYVGVDISDDIFVVDIDL